MSVCGMFPENKTRIFSLLLRVYRLEKNIPIEIETYPCIRIKKIVEITIFKVVFFVLFQMYDFKEKKLNQGECTAGRSVIHAKISLER